MRENLLGFFPRSQTAIFVLFNNIIKNESKLYFFMVLSYHLNEIKIIKLLK